VNAVVIWQDLMIGQRRNAIGIFIAIGVAVTILAFNRKHTDDDLIGVWKLDTEQTSGQSAYSNRQLWVIRHGTLTIVDDGGIGHFEISVDPSSNPKILDVHRWFQPIGVYEIDGDILRVCRTVAQLPRPTEFITKLDDLRTLSVLQRLDADPRMSSDELRDLFQTEFGPRTEYPEFDKEAEEFVYSLMRDEPTEWWTEKRMVFEDVVRLITEINNGGLHQFFYNGTGDTAVETISFLRRIGAPETAKLIEAACQLFLGGTVPEDYRERRVQLEHFTHEQLKTLGQLEEQFFSRKEDLFLLLRKFWESDSQEAR
jgi:uncharacterized protein (TIGR03067 family)